MYEQLLAQTGLKYQESLIYEVLLKDGELTAGKLAKKTPLKRGLVYKTLEDLEKRGLVERIEKPNKATRFKAAHPSELNNLVNKKEEEIRDAKTTIQEIMPKLISDFNLAAGKPGVRFFGGLEGVKEVANDSLTAKSAILSYVDVEAVEKNLAKINKEYIKKREKLKKQKRIIVTNSPFNKDYFKKLGPEVTDVRFIDFEVSPFGAVMQIYDGKVSYIVMHPKSMLGIIIEDENIAKMHRSLFEYTWSTAKPTAEQREI